MDLVTVGMIGLLIVVGYFMLIRPQQKRTKEQQNLLKSLGPGSRVMMSSGIFGTVRHMGDKQVIVEVSPGVEMTFVRQALVRPLADDEEEFEYEDTSEPQGATASDVGWTAPVTGAETPDDAATLPVAGASAADGAGEAADDEATEPGTDGSSAPSSTK